MKRVEVELSSSKRWGYLYFETDTHLVLLNNIAAEANLGSLKSERHLHLDPEADIVVVPRSEVRRLRKEGEDETLEGA